MSSSNIKRLLAEAERTIRLLTGTNETLSADLKAQMAIARRVQEAEEQVRTLTEQRDRLIQLVDELGLRARVAVRPASTIALDPVRWVDWCEERPQMPSTREA